MITKKCHQKGKFEILFWDQERYHSINTTFFMTKTVAKKCPKNLALYDIYADRPSYLAFYFWSFGQKVHPAKELVLKGVWNILRTSKKLTINIPQKSWWSLMKWIKEYHRKSRSWLRVWQILLIQIINNRLL